MLRNDPRYKDNLTDFQRRYEPNFAAGQAISTMLALPGLRGLWPMSVFASGGDALDLSGCDKTLTYNGNPTYHYAALHPHIYFDGTGDYLSRPDEAHFDISGTESYVAAYMQGLTLGGWFYFNANGASNGAIGKWLTGGNQQAYLLYRTNTNVINFLVSYDGSNNSGANSGAYTTIAQTWHFCVGRFTTSNREAAVWLDEHKAVATLGVLYTSIFNSSAALEIGRGDGSLYLTGAASLVFLCAAALSDAQIYNVYHQTRALFGK